LDGASICRNRSISLDSAPTHSSTITRTMFVMILSQEFPAQVLLCQPRLQRMRLGRLFADRDFRDAASRKFIFSKGMLYLAQQSFLLQASVVLMDQINRLADLGLRGLPQICQQNTTIRLVEQRPI